jgi:DNA modification methylase
MLPPMASQVQSAEVLKGDPDNPREIDAAALAGLGVSVEEFGDLSGIVFNDRLGLLVAGHQRMAVLRAAGVTTFTREGDRGEIVHPATGERFAIRFVDWDDEKHRTANLIANSPEIAGRYTDAALGQIKALEGAATFEALRLGDLEAHIADELARLQAEHDVPAAGNTDPDDVPEPPAEPITSPGDMWILGEHRLLCGDATEPADVARLMEGTRAVLMNTDPPYGIDYTRLKAGMIKKGWKAIENDELTDGAELQAFLEQVIRVAVPHLTTTCAFYLWHPMLTQGTFFAAAAAAADILIHRQIIWVKPQLILTRSGMYHWKHELCFFGWVRGHQPPWYGEKNQTSVIEAGRDQDLGQHPTQKPVALFEFPLHNHARRGEICYEPFSGSGSQLIAAERLGRRCFALEIEPAYVDVAVARWEQFTGRKAAREPAAAAAAE